MAHCTALINNLTIGKHVQILSYIRGVMSKRIICDEKQRYLGNEAV